VVIIVPSPLTAAVQQRGRACLDVDDQVAEQPLAQANQLRVKFFGSSL
jgi:hypothetical protein